MPLYRKTSDLRGEGITIDGYEMVWDPSSNTWLFSHVLADWYNLWKGDYSREDGEHCHHIDFDKKNNDPSNIIRLSGETTSRFASGQVSQDPPYSRGDRKEQSNTQSENFKNLMCASNERVRDSKRICLRTQKLNGQIGI